MVDIVNGVKHVELPGGSSSSRPSKAAKRARNNSDHSSLPTEDKNSQLTISDPLKESLQKENVFLRCLVDTIPPTVFFTSDILETVDYHKHNPANPINGLRTGATNGNSRPSKKSKQKRDRLDPLQSKTVTGIHQELSKLDSPKKPKRPTNNVNRSADDRLNSMDELKARLASKLAVMRGAKPVNNEEYCEKKRLKRRMSKLKLKERRKSGKAPPVNSNGLAKVAPAPAKPVFNMEGKMVFSKFDFTDGAGGSEGKRGAFSGRNYKQLMSKVQKTEEKISLLKEAEPEKADQLKSKLQWQAVLEKAEGIKVKNDPVKLQRAAKRQDKRKESSGKKWEARTEAVANKKDSKQKRRSDNLKSRKDSKIKTKIKKAVKKGRLVPGHC